MFDLDAAAPLAAALSMLLVGFFVGMMIGAHVTNDHRMTEAYNLGFAQECLGKEGYYFTCEEENE